MFRSLAAAGLAALSIASFTPAANADVDVRLFLGGPSYNDNCVWNGHRYKCAPDSDNWVFENHRPRRHHQHELFLYDNDDDFIDSKMSCSAAKELVYDRGFYRVKAKDCSGKTYGFQARRNGKHYYITVNAWTGKMTASRV